MSWQNETPIETWSAQERVEYRGWCFPGYSREELAEASEVDELQFRADLCLKLADDYFGEQMYTKTYVERCELLELYEFWLGAKEKKMAFIYRKKDPSEWAADAARLSLEQVQDKCVWMNHMALRCYERGDLSMMPPTSRSGPTRSRTSST